MCSRLVYSINVPGRGCDIIRSVGAIGVWLQVLRTLQTPNDIETKKPMALYEEFEFETRWQRFSKLMGCIIRGYHNKTSRLHTQTLR